MITWSRSLSPIRKQLSFLDAEDQSEDLIDVGDDDDGLEWKVVKILTYRWSGTKEGRWAVSDTFACLMNQRAAMTGDLYWPSSSSISGPYDAVMMACTVSPSIRITPKIMEPCLVAPFNACHRGCREETPRG